MGLGWFQITGRPNWKAHGLDIRTALLACPNLRAGAEHFAANVKDAARQLYNSGRIDGAPRYGVMAEQVVHTFMWGVANCSLDSVIHAATLADKAERDGGDA